MTISSAQFMSRIKQFIKQLQILTWLEIFEKWFGFFIKLLWIGAFIAFSIYLYKEYHKNVFYLKDFKVPTAWADQGYTGEVVKEAILDEIDKIKLEAYQHFGDRYTKSSRGKDNDNTQILSDINVEGFNLKVIVKTILAILGKKDKSIGGYVTVSDSSQTMAIQITDQITKPFSIGKQQPIKNLIHDATLHIMRVKQPLVLFSYYNIKRDTAGIIAAYNYLEKHRELINDDDFYIAATGMGLFTKNYEKASAWSDSLVQKFPDDMNSYSTKALVYEHQIAYSDADSLKKVKYTQLYIANLNKAIATNATKEGKERLDNRVYLRLFGYYYSRKEYKQAIEAAEKANAIEALNAQYNNFLAYAYMGQKNYTKAEQLLKKVTDEEPKNGNYWDSLAELYCIEGKDSLAVINLKKALIAPQKSEAVSVQAYQKDIRWQRLQKRKDFRALVGQL
jgi:tetratricopeptide (TPR) repeat protein